MSGLLSSRPLPESILGRIEEACSRVGMIVSELEEAVKDATDDDELDWLELMLADAKRAESEIESAHSQALALREALG